MNRSLEHDQMIVSCMRGHTPVSMDPAGFYALKEAGAPRTIIAFKCPKCPRQLFVTEEQPYPLTAEVREAIDSTE